MLTRLHVCSAHLETDNLGHLVLQVGGLLHPLVHLQHSPCLVEVPVLPPPKREVQKASVLII